MSNRSSKVAKGGPAFGVHCWQIGGFARSRAGNALRVLTYYELPTGCGGPAFAKAFYNLFRGGLLYSKGAFVLFVHGLFYSVEWRLLHFSLRARSSLGPLQRGVTTAEKLTRKTCFGTEIAETIHSRQVGVTLKRNIRHYFYMHRNFSICFEFGWRIIIFIIIIIIFICPVSCRESFW